MAGSARSVRPAPPPPWEAPLTSQLRLESVLANRQRGKQVSISRTMATAVPLPKLHLSSLVEATDRWLRSLPDISHRTQEPFIAWKLRYKTSSVRNVGHHHPPCLRLLLACAHLYSPRLYTATQLSFVSQTINRLNIDRLSCHWS